LRIGLIEVARARRSAAGQHDRQALLYAYLTGPEFRHRIQALVESLVEMKSQLDKEKRSMETAWKRRERTMERAVNSVASMYGDLQGLGGGALADVPALALPDAAGDIDDPALERA
jgi:hypothetical protein